MLKQALVALHKHLASPSETAKASSGDMKAYFNAKDPLIRDEIAAKQIWLALAVLAARD